MKIEASGKLSQKIAVLAEKLWLRYLCHPFITQMADGTLPLEKFRYYMLQVPAGLHKDLSGDFAKG